MFISNGPFVVVIRQRTMPGLHHVPVNKYCRPLRAPIEFTGFLIRHRNQDDLCTEIVFMIFGNMMDDAGF